VSLCITFARNSMLQTYQNKWLLQTSADTFLGLHLQISLRFCNISENGEHVYFCRELLYLCINVQYSMLMGICLSVLINEENCFRTYPRVQWSVGNFYFYYFIFKRSTVFRSAWSFGFFIPTTTANDLRLRRITIPYLFQYNIFLS